MTRRALLIGSETFGLSGCNDDVSLMRDVLALHHFTEVNVLVDTGATRDGILAGFEWLTEASGPQDAALVYFSGHGGRFPLPGWQARQAAGRDAFAQFIVPHDMAQTTAEDFRGLLSLELSGLQSRLTAKTSNVTTILDCCHSGLMSRDATLIPKAVSRDFPLDAALERLAGIEAGAGATGRDGNRDAVRVVACAPSQSAFEGPSQFRPGERHGMLTDALAYLLQVTGAPPVSWRMLAERLRVMVSTASPMQRPEAEGPSRRLPFTVEEGEPPGVLPVRVDAGEIWVGGAELLGVSPGDRYLLLDGDRHELGTVTAGALADGRVRLSPDDRAVDLGPAVAAVPLRTSSRRPVSVDVPAPLRAAVLTAVEASATLSVSGAGQPAIASVTLDDGLLVRDSAGLPLHAGRLGTDAAAVRAATELMENVAKAYRFRSLQPAETASRLAQPVDVTFWLHPENGTPTVIAGSGERLFAGDRVSMTIRNRGPEPLFFWLFDVGTDATIALVTDASPSGRPLAPAGEPGDTVTFGGSSGIALQWPGSLPRDGGRLETFVVIVADRAQDLSSLGTRITRQVPTPLQAALEEASTGVRNWPAESDAVPAAPLRYQVDTCDVVLEPGPRPRLDEPEFALDQRPDLSLRMLVPRGGARVPKKVAVRLVALSVLKNRALMRATVRLDAMVITGRPDGGAVATPLTQRFAGIADGDLLPMDNLLLYTGPVREFLDIAIWVNRDDDKGASLADMFASDLHQTAVRSALTVVGGLVLAAPTVAAGVGAVVAVAELVRVGAHLVSTAVGKNIGLYRTSMLPAERFGVGRHPDTGTRQAQQIDFAYEILEQP
jgi:caspase domain-containing protein